MNAALPHLARAAGVGALIGVGLELWSQGETPGYKFLASVVTSVALSALAYYLGAYAAVGIVIGGIAGHTDIHKMAGGAIIGGTIGYLLGPTLASMPVIWVI